MRDNDTHKNYSQGAIFKAVIVPIRQCNEAKKALPQSKRHKQ